MARQTLKDFLRDISTEDRVAYTIDQDGLIKDLDDLGVDPGTNKSLIQKSLDETGLIGDYLKYITDISNNAYALSGGSIPSTGPDFPGNRGTPLAAVTPTDGDAFIYTNESDPLTLGGVMASYSNGYLGASAVQEIVSKDASVVSLSGKHTNELLSTIPASTSINKDGKTFPGPASDGGNKVLRHTVEATMNNGNRFNATYQTSTRKAFAPQGSEEGTSAGSFESGERQTGTYRTQSGYGKYSSSGVGGQEITIDMLKNIAGRILASSAGDIDSKVFATAAAGGGYNKIEPGSLSTAEAARQEGIDIDFSAVDFLTADISPDAAWYTRSWGTSNTPDEPFSQGNNLTKNPTIMAAAAIVALMKLSSTTLGLLATGIDSRVDLARGPFIPGQSTYIAKQAKFAHLANLCLVPTKNPYSDCVNQGFLALFGTESPSSEKITVSQQIHESAGFWASVGNSILKSFTEIDRRVHAERFRSSVPKGIASTLSAVGDSSILKITNAMATVGDIFITSQGKKRAPDPTLPVGPWNVDRLPDGPSTRISKSRSQNGATAMSLAWRNTSVPSMFQIPRNVILAAADMGNLGDGTNPLKGHVGTELITDTYIDVNAEGGAARIPSDIVERFENQLDAEYVPFYFHDLRTNEITAFHAFLESLTDTYSPRWIESQGLGRIDPVQVYKSTSRTLRLSFYVAATSKEDFDQMWWKINKLTTLVYPQWTEGTQLSTKVQYKGEETDSTFIQPFSQVLGASPIIRLRVGDVVKSNYSKFNLARVFGVGNDSVDPKPNKAEPEGFFEKIADKLAELEIKAMEAQYLTTFNALYGSPMTWFNGLGGDRMVRAVASQLLPNGFANPLGAALIMRELQSPDVEVNLAKMNLTIGGVIEAAAGGLRNSAQDILGFTPLSFPFLRPTAGRQYVQKSNGKKWRFTRPVRVIVLGRDQVTLPEAKLSSSNADGVFKGPRNAGTPVIKTQYTVAILDLNAPASLFGKEFVVSHEDLMPNPNAIFNTYALPALNIAGVLSTLAQGLANEVATATGVPADELKMNMSDAAEFMHEEVNPITRAFASTAGRGLGGVITNLNYEMLDGTNTWETDWNSRAPISIKVGMSFTAIHDIPPGLDYSGYNRAPIYNVGNVMKHVAGDPHRDDGKGSKDYYTAQGRYGLQSEDPSDD
jgi:hypothetical protein